MRILGLDPGGTTGAVLLDVYNNGVISEPRSYTLKANQKLKGMFKYIQLADQVKSLILRTHPTVIAVEDFIVSGGGKKFNNKNTNRRLAELGVLVRYHAYLNGCIIVELTPAAIKKFATGKGNSSKDAVISSISEYFGFEGNEHECDAFAAAYFTASLVTDLDLTQERMDALAAWKAQNQDTLTELVSDLANPL